MEKKSLVCQGLARETDKILEPILLACGFQINAYEYLPSTGTVLRAGTDKMSTRPSVRADILLKIVDGLAQLSRGFRAVLIASTAHCQGLARESPTEIWEMAVNQARQALRSLLNLQRHESRHESRPLLNLPIPRGRHDPFFDYYCGNGQLPAPKRVEVDREPLPATGRPRPSTLSLKGELNSYDGEGRHLVSSVLILQCEEEMARAVNRDLVGRTPFLARVRSVLQRVAAAFWKRRNINDSGDEEVVCCSCFALTRRSAHVSEAMMAMGENALRRESRTPCEAAV